MAEYQAEKQPACAIILLDKYMRDIYTLGMKEIFGRITGFEWDDGNREKNRLKHDVLNGECEDIFFNQPLISLEDSQHSKNEKRYAALGVTDTGRGLTVVFTLRGDLIRVISVRDMNKKERRFYETQSQ